MVYTKFALIATTPHEESKVYNDLLNRKQITEIHSIFGEYDLIAKCEGENEDNLTTFINGIKNLKGVEKIKALSGPTPSS